MQYIVKRGREIGTILVPHRHSDGMYVASRSRFARDYVRVANIKELEALVSKGFGVRMSNRGSEYHRAPSLISPGNVKA